MGEWHRDMISQTTGDAQALEQVGYRLSDAIAARDVKIAQLEAVAEAAEKALAQAEGVCAQTGGVVRAVLLGIVLLLRPPLAALKGGKEDGE